MRRRDSLAVALWAWGLLSGPALASEGEDSVRRGRALRCAWRGWWGRWLRDEAVGDQRVSIHVAAALATSSPSSSKSAVPA